MNDRIVVGVRIYVPFFDKIVRAFSRSVMWLEYSFEEHQRSWIIAAVVLAAIAVAVIIVCDIKLSHMGLPLQF